MNYWFGEPWPSENYRAPVCEDDAYRVDVPVGETCWMCAEPVAAGDQGNVMPGYHDGATIMMYNHRECILRNVMGCWSSLQGGPHLHDRTDLTYRQEALLIADWVSTQRDPMR